MLVETRQRHPSLDIPPSHGLWSLWDIMDKFEASQLFEVCRVVSKWANTKYNDESTVTEDSRKNNAEALKSYEIDFRGIGLSASHATVKKMISEFEKSECKWKAISLLAEEFLGRFIDETDDKHFFSLAPRDAEFFNQPKRGWEASINRFPQIIDDVEEASKCFAFSRYSAAVFHSLQVVEAGLIELGKFIDVNDPKSGWTAVSGALSKILKMERKDMTRFQKTNYAFLEQIQGTVEGLKNAWRNKISHVDGRLVLMTKDFSPEVAEEIIFATRAFMRRLAEGLPPSKLKKAVSSGGQPS